MLTPHSCGDRQSAVPGRGPEGRDSGPGPGWSVPEGPVRAVIRQCQNLPHLRGGWTGI